MAETISWALSLIATVLGLVEPFSKKMSLVLLLSFIGNLLVGTSYLLVGQSSGALICFVACVQLFINSLYDRKKKKVPLWLIVIYSLAFLGVNLMSFAAWYDVLALLAALCFVLSVAQPDPKYYRLFFVSNSSLWIVYDFLAGAWGNLFTHVTLFVATLLAIYFRDVRGKKKAQ